MILRSSQLVRPWRMAVCSLVLLVFFSCEKETTVTPAFYHWQTNLALSQTEQAYLDSLHVQKLYAKFFDVTWDARREMPIPVAEVKELEEWKMGGWENGRNGGMEDGRNGTLQPFTPSPLQLIPCIFITNESFQKLPNTRVAWLSERVSEKLRALWQQMPEQKMTEVQFDCDWTASTRERFFRFLEYFKKMNPGVKLSATIRLHQVRDHEQTGVPPVDRGMLMFYNTGDLENWYENNSILNLDIAENYLPISDFRFPTSDFRFPTSEFYPLPLDVALPIFAWGVLFRDGRMIRLINNLRTEALSDTARFRKIAENRFEVVKSTYLDGYYLYENDRIRLEAIDKKLLFQATDLLTNRLNNRNLTVAFYHLDTATIKYFPYEVLEDVCEKFSE